MIRAFIRALLIVLLLVGVGASAFRVGVIFYRPKTMRVDTFEMGFVKAMELLEQATLEVVVEWINLDDFEGMRPEVLNLTTRFNHLALLLVKSNWEWTVDKFVRTYLRPEICALPKVLLISGVHPPPAQREDVMFYNALVFETHWYHPQIAAHPLTMHAFGIDTSVMSGSLCTNQAGRTRAFSNNFTVPERMPWEWDWLFIGAFRDYKRPWLLSQKTGRRLALGEGAVAKESNNATGADPEASRIIERLQLSGVQVRGPVEYLELRELICRSRQVYIPATTFGGGERAMLEAVSVGAPVVVEADNPKLRELLAAVTGQQSPGVVPPSEGHTSKKGPPGARAISGSEGVYDEWYYASQMALVIESTMSAAGLRERALLGLWQIWEQQKNETVPRPEAAVRRRKVSNKIKVKKRVANDSPKVISMTWPQQSARKPRLLVLHCSSSSWDVYSATADTSTSLLLSGARNYVDIWSWNLRLGTLTEPLLKRPRQEGRSGSGNQRTHRITAGVAVSKEECRRGNELDCNVMGEAWEWVREFALRQRQPTHNKDHKLNRCESCSPTPSPYSELAFDAVLGVGDFQGAVDFTLSTMHLNMAHLGPDTNEMHKALWLQGQGAEGPWGAEPLVYSLLLLTGRSESQNTSSAMDGDPAQTHTLFVEDQYALEIVQNHHHVVSLPLLQSTNPNQPRNEDAISVSTSVLVDALLTLVPPSLRTSSKVSGDRQPIKRYRGSNGGLGLFQWDWTIGALAASPSVQGITVAMDATPLHSPPLFSLSQEALSALSSPSTTDYEPERQQHAEQVMHAGMVTDIASLFVADPFVLATSSSSNTLWGGLYWLFFEVCPMDLHGVIAVASSEDGVQWRYHSVVLREPEHHLSFPYVFYDHTYRSHSNTDNSGGKGRWYMVVEARNSGCIPLYTTTCSAFPHDWVLLRCLLGKEQDSFGFGLWRGQSPEQSSHEGHHSQRRDDPSLPPPHSYQDSAVFQWPPPMQHSNSTPRWSGRWYIATTTETYPHEWTQRLYVSVGTGSTALLGPFMTHPGSPVAGAKVGMRSAHNGSAGWSGCGNGRLGGRLLLLPDTQVAIQAHAGGDPKWRHLYSNSNSTILPDINSHYQPHSLYRLAQVCAPKYGTRVDAWRVTTLDEHFYKEQWMGPVLLPESAERSTDKHGMRNKKIKWNTNMKHHLDLVPLLPKHAAAVRKQMQVANGIAVGEKKDISGSGGTSSGWLAVLDGAIDGGGLRCREMWQEGRCPFSTFGGTTNMERVKVLGVRDGDTYKLQHTTGFNSEVCFTVSLVTPSKDDISSLAAATSAVLYPPGAVLWPKKEWDHDHDHELAKHCIRESGHFRLTLTHTPTECGGLVLQRQEVHFDVVHGP